MSTLFSSPGKQAGQTSQADLGILNQIVGEQQKYNTASEANMRAAMTGLGPNPFFAAADQMKPDAYAVNAKDTTSFGTPVPGPGAGGTGTTNITPSALPRPVMPPPPNGGAGGAGAPPPGLRPPPPVGSQPGGPGGGPGMGGGKKIL